MKKKIAAALAVTFALGVTSAFAANPFVDVPAKHWAYDAVSKLAQEGIVDGYGDGTFRGDRNITRYEMAQIVAKALAKEDKANAEQKALLNKLSAEFSEELDNLGVRVSKLEKNASSVKITGDARIRGFENNTVDAATGDSIGSKNYFEQRIRLYLDATLDKNVAFNGRISAQNKSNSDAIPAENNGFNVDYGYFTFKDAIGGTNVSLGRQPLTLGYGLVSNPIGGYDAVKVAFGGDKVKAVVGYGDISQQIKTYGNDVVVTTANVTYDASKSFQAIGSVYYSNSQAYDYEVYSLGAKAKLDNNFTVIGEYATNEGAASGADDHAINAQVAYKGANKANPKSFGLFVNYRKYGAASVDHVLTSVPVFEGRNDGFTFANGVKGLGYGFNYAVAKNVIATVTYEDLESYNGNTDRAGFGYARAEFWF